MDPPLISDGQLRACNQVEFYETLLPFPKSSIGCLVYLIKNDSDVSEDMLKWLKPSSKRLAEIRKCDFELLSSFPSNYKFYTLIYSPDENQNFISENILIDEESKRKYNKNV